MTRPIDPRLVAAVPRVRPLLAALTVTQFGGGLLAVAQAVLFAKIIGAQFASPRAGVTGDLIALAIVGLLRAGVVAAQEWGTSRAAVQVQSQLRSCALAAVLRLGPAWAQRQPAGRLVTATGTGLEVVDGYVTRALPAMTAACVTPPVVLLAIGVEDWQSAVVLLVVLPLIPVFMVLVGITTRRRMVVQHAALAAMAGHFLDLVQGLTTLKVYGQAHRQRETVERDTETYRRTTMGMLRMAFMSALVLDLVATLGIAVVAVDVGLRLDGGRLSLTQALVVLLLAPELFAPLRAVGAQFHANEAGQVAIGAALDILDEAGQVPPVIGGAAPSGLTGGLRITALSLTYPGRLQPALADVNLTIEPGQVVGIQGVSGAGKSSLLAMILGFQGGGGSIARSSVAGWRTGAEHDGEQWRQTIAWVPQRPSPTQQTVGREVLLGDPLATPHEVASVLRLCRAPAADTPVGEDGRGISAGERRRVALARVVLRARAVIASGQTPLVLLDEPSEDLDEATQGAVIEVIASLAGRATILIATHSETVLEAADRRVTVEAGRVMSVVDQTPVRLPASPSAQVPGQRRVRRAAAAVPPYPLQTLTIAKRRLILPSLISGAAGLCGVALTATSLWLICRASERPNVQALAIAVVGVRTFALGRALLRYGERLSGHDAALRSLRDVRSQVFGGLIPLAPGGLGGFRRGDLLRRFVTDVDAVQEGLVRAAIPTAGAAITALGASVLATVLNLRAGLVLASGMVVAVVVMPLLTRRLAGPGGGAAESLAQRDTLLSATLDGLAELTAYGAHHVAHREVVLADQRAGWATRRVAWAAGFGGLLAGLTATVTTVGVLEAGVHARGLSPVSIGLLLACSLAAFDAVAPLPAAFAAWGRFCAARGRVDEVMQRRPVMPVGDHCAPAGRQIGLYAESAAFAPAPDAPLLMADLNLSVAPGQRVAVMGASGSGKSTLLAAALRLQPTAGGTFSIASPHRSELIADVAEAAMPSLVAGSLQGDHVFNASLRDNLRVVRPEASDEELDAAAQCAGLLDVVHALVSGWSTIAGPDGSSLSGGQRQRLLLARAVLGDPAVLVLDEPTAHLDAATELQVLNRLCFRRDHTMLITTHRRLPAGSVDTVLEIRSGHLTERDQTEALAQL